MNAIDIHGINKSYGEHQALADLDLAIPEGRIFGLLGPNGAGKTTLIRIINQILAPDSGRVEFFGQVLQPSDVRRIGYLPEERGLYKKMKVGEQAIYLAQLKGMQAVEAKRKLETWFERWEMMDWWNLKVEELSKGMAQKIQFITTVLHEPKLLIFDEPFSGFDPVNAELIQNEILRLHNEGATIIFSTHRMESVEELCTDIALINHGRKVLEGAVHQIKDAHRNGRYDIDYRAATPVDFQLPNGVTLETLDSDIPGIQSAVISAPGLKASDIMVALAQQCEPITIKEHIPSVHEIFVQTVTES